MSGVYCYLGPSLNMTLARALRPDVIFLPPIAHGDLIELDPQPDDEVIIVDGFFYQRPPVRHKEILDCLDRGVTVVGAASMGALRAVELAPMGMRGEGVVYNLYARGPLDGDDEVAVLHGLEDDGYASLSEAMVNVRATCNRMVHRGVLLRHHAILIVSAAKDMAFWERSYPAILERATAYGLPGEAVTAFTAALLESRRDVKAEDAAQVLHNPRIATHRPLHRATEGVLGTKHETVYLHLWRYQQAVHLRCGGVSANDHDALSFCQSLASDYPTVHEQTVLEVIGAMEARRRGTEAPDGDVLVEVFRETQGLSTKDCPDWLAARGVSLVELRALLAWRWLAGDQTLDLFRGIDRTTLVDSAFRFASASAILPTDGRDRIPLRPWLTAAELRGLDERERLARLVVRTFQVSPGISLRGPLILAIKLQPGFLRALEGVLHVRRFNQDMKARDRRHDPTRVRHHVVMRWFCRRWNALDDPHPVLCSRGFRGRMDLLERASEFAVFDSFRSEFRDFSLGSRGQSRNDQGHACDAPVVHIAAHN